MLLLLWFIEIWKKNMEPHDIFFSLSYQNYQQPQRFQNSDSFFSDENQWNLSDFFSLINVKAGDQLLLI